MISNAETMFDFTPDESLSFPDFLRLMYGVYKIEGEGGGEMRLCRFSLNDKALNALPEEFRKYFVPQDTREYKLYEGKVPSADFKWSLRDELDSRSRNADTQVEPSGRKIG